MLSSCCDQASAPKAKATSIRSSRFLVADGAASCGGAEGTAASSCSRLCSLARNDPSPSSSYSSAAWTSRSVAVLKLVCVPQSSRFSSFYPWRGATGPLLSLPQFCPQEWKQRDANRLLALPG